MTPAKQLRSQSFVWFVALMALLTACGEDGDGNNDTIWTGISGLVIVVILGVIVLRKMGKK